MRCTYYYNSDYNERCVGVALVHLFAPDGRPVPGGRFCNAHAQECITEYADKLQETWTAQPIDEWGHVNGEHLTVKKLDIFGVVHDTHATEAELNGWHAQQGALL